MEDKDKLIKQLQSKVDALESEKAKASEPETFRGYSCAKCGTIVNLSFPMPALLKSQLCPDCFHGTPKKQDNSNTPDFIQRYKLAQEYLNATPERQRQIIREQAKLIKT